MGLLSKTDEVKFLLQTFDFLLPQLKGDDAILKDMKVLRSELLSKESILIGYYANPYTQRDADLSQAISDGLREQLNPMLTKIDEFCDSLETGHAKDLTKLKAEMQTKNTAVNNLIDRVKLFLKGVEAEEKQLNQLRAQVQDEQLSYARAHQDALASVERAIEFQQRTDIPAIRKHRHQVVSSDLQSLIEAIKQTADSSGFKEMLTAKVDDAQTDTLNKLRNAAQNIVPEFQNNKASIDTTLSEWQKALTDLLPTTEIFGDKKKMYKNYEALLAQIKSNETVPIPKREEMTRLLNERYLNNLLIKKFDAAAAGYKTTEKEWAALLQEAAAKQQAILERSKTLDDLLQKYILEMEPGHIRAFENEKAAFTMSLGEQNYEAANAALNQMDACLDKEKLDEAIALKNKITEKWRRKLPLFQPSLDMLTRAQDSIGLRFSRSPRDVGWELEVLMQESKVRPRTLTIMEVDQKLKAIEKEHDDLLKEYDDFFERTPEANDFEDMLKEQETETKKQEECEKQIMLARVEAERLRKEIAECEVRQKNLQKSLNDASPNKKLAAQIQLEIKESAAKNAALSQELSTAVGTLNELKQKNDRIKSELEEQARDVFERRQELDAKLLTGLSKDIQDRWNQQEQDFKATLNQKRAALESTPEFETLSADLLKHYTGTQTDERTAIRMSWSTLIKRIPVVEPNLNGKIQEYEQLNQTFKSQKLIINDGNLTKTVESITVDKLKTEGKQTLYELALLRPQDDIRDRLSTELQGAETEVQTQAVLFNIEKHAKEVRSDADALKASISSLQSLRLLIGAEFATREKMRKEMNGLSRLMESKTKFIDMAFESVRGQLSQFTAPLIEYLANAEEISDNRTDLDNLLVQVRALDAAGDGEVTKQFKDLDSRLSAGSKQLNKAKILRTVEPKDWDKFQDEINAIKENLSKVSLAKSQKDLVFWENRINMAITRAGIASQEITHLKQLVKDLTADIKANETPHYTAFPKLYQTLTTTVAGIQSCTTREEYDAAMNTYREMLDLHQDSLASPQAAGEQEQRISAEQEQAILRKNQWDATLAEFKSRHWTELKELIKTQKSNTDDDTEKGRLSDAMKKAEQDLESATDAAARGAYKEAIQHLAEIRRIIDRLKKYPEGMQVHRLNSLAQIPADWKAAIIALKAGLDAFMQQVTTAAEGDAAQHLSLVTDEVTELKETFDPQAFDVVIMKLTSREKIDQSREAGLAKIRDNRTILQQKKIEMLKQNPFRSLSKELKKVELQLMCIEKNLMIYN